MSERADITGSSDIVQLGDEEATVAGLLAGRPRLVGGCQQLDAVADRPKVDASRVDLRLGPHRSDHGSNAAVRDLAAELTRLGCDIVTGGGPVLMQAANEGARLAGADVNTGSVGIRVDLPFEQDVNPFVGQVFEHRTFFSRLHHFVLVSDAFVVVPGGIGTVLVTMMIWQLLQVRKLHDTPLVMAGAMWAELVEWAKKLDVAA